VLLASVILVPVVLTYLSAGHETLSNQIALMAGTAAFSLMAANMVLAARPAGIEQWVGGLDRVYELHKWMGGAVLALILIHSQVAFEQLDGVAPPGSLGAVAAEVGELALWPFVIILVLALVKRLPKLPFEIPYQVWRQSHRLVGIAFVALAFHQLFVRAPFGATDLISHWLIAMAVIGTAAFLWTQLAAGLRPRRYEVVEVDRIGAATRVRAEPVGRGLAPVPGQFAFLSVSRRGLREPHPFTLSKVDTNGAVEFTIRALGDFTKRLHDTIAVGDKVKIEGGYGRFQPQKAGKTQLWVAGGIGITPFLAAAEALQPERAQQIVLIHAVRHAEEAIGADRLRAVAARIPGFSYHAHISQTDGRLTGDMVLDRLPFDLSQAEFWFCGPAPLRQALSAQFKAAGKSPRSTHFERFEFR